MDMGKLFRGAISTPLMTVNLASVIILSLVAVSEFNYRDENNMIKLTDTAFQDSPAFDPTMVPPAATYLTDAATVALDDELCDEHDRICGISHVSRLVVGHSGWLSAFHFVDLAKQSVKVTHLIWVVSWFTTPISLFLFANANWFSYERWMWWSLYAFIFIWDAFGLVMMLFEEYTPLYNAAIAIIYCVFSTMLIFSVREAWKVVSHDGIEKKQVFASAASGSTAKIPKLMQVSLTNTKPAYILAGSSDAPPIPTEIRYIYSQTALVIVELFFIFPVLYMIGTAMIQYRITPFDLQVRYWLSTLFYGSLVLLEKSRRVGVTYMTDVFLITFALATTIALHFYFVTDFMILFTMQASDATYVIWGLLVGSHLIGLGVIVSNIFLASIMQKGTATMTEIQEDGTSDNTKILQGLETGIFRSSLVLLSVTKIALSVFLVQSSMHVL